MMVSNIEYYEALRAHLPDEVAKLIADRSPQLHELATKSDLEAVKSELRGDFQELRADFQEFKADMRGWMLAFFVPLWVGVYGTLGAVIVTLIVRG